MLGVGLLFFALHMSGYMACELLEVLLSASHLSIGTLIHLYSGSHICLTNGYLLGHIPSLLLLIFDTWSSYVAQVGLILLPQLPVLLNCRLVP